MARDARRRRDGARAADLSLQSTGRAHTHTTMRPRETAKTKLIRLLFFACNLLTLGLGLGLCYLGGSQQVDPEARARTANRTAALVPAGANGTLAGAEANAAPYSRMLMIGVMIVLESLLGMVGALRTQKHRDRRRGVLLLYHAVLLATASSCIWMTVMCLFFAAQADACVDSGLSAPLLLAWLAAHQSDAQVRGPVLGLHRGCVPARHLRDGGGGYDRCQPHEYRSDRRDYRCLAGRRPVQLRLISIALISTVCVQTVPL